MIHAWTIEPTPAIGRIDSGDQLVAERKSDDEV